MLSPPITTWLDILWSAVCKRAARPLPGLHVTHELVRVIATKTFDNFLASGGQPAPNLTTMLGILTGPVKNDSLAAIALARRDENQPDLYRDTSVSKWERNPDFERLKKRDSHGVLVSPEWTIAEPILWQSASPAYYRIGIRDSEVRDVYSETVADFLQARTDLDKCPMKDMHVFEELPRLFKVVAERRAISWVRHQTAKKNTPNRSKLSINDPDLKLAEQLKSDRPFSPVDPLAHADFSQIQAACRDALGPAEWHLIEVLFVESSSSREQVAQNPEMLALLNLDLSASRSTQIRRLNTIISDSLSALGEALSKTDL